MLICLANLAIFGAVAIVAVLIMGIAVLLAGRQEAPRP